MHSALRFYLPIRLNVAPSLDACSCACCQNCMFEA